MGEGKSFCFCLIEGNKNHPFRSQMSVKMKESLAPSPSRNIDKSSKNGQNQLYLNSGKEPKVYANEANAQSGKRQHEHGRKALWCFPCLSLISFPSMAGLEDISLCSPIWGPDLWFLREQSSPPSHSLVCLFWHVWELPAGLTPDTCLFVSKCTPRKRCKAK